MDKTDKVEIIITFSLVAEILILKQIIRHELNQDTFVILINIKIRQCKIKLKNEINIKYKWAIICGVSLYLLNNNKGSPYTHQNKNFIWYNHKVLININYSC